MKFIKDVMAEFNRYMFTDRLSMFDMMFYGFLLMLSIELREPLLLLLLIPSAFFSAWMNTRVTFKDYDKG